MAEATEVDHAMPEIVREHQPPRGSGDYSIVGYADPGDHAITREAYYRARGE